MPDPAALLEFQITVAAWRRIPRLRARLQQAAEATAAHLPKKFRFPFSATVLLTGNAKVRQLNRDFRGIDLPTNVLSFPQFTPAELTISGKGKDRLELGDIAIANQYVVKEAKTDHKILINHLTHLVIHGLLHLFGYDHMDDGEAEAMEKREIGIMKALGLPDPYAVFPPPRQKTKTGTTGKRQK
jgi:probable rRNA maturation factor